MKKLYLIIPVYNGAQYIESTVSELERFFSHQDILVDIVWVDDGSTDTTVTTLHNTISKSELNMQVLSYEQNKGKGYAIQYAIVHIDGEYEYIAFTDVEIPYGLLPLMTGIEHMGMHMDISMVVGSRHVADGSQAQYHWYRRVVHHMFRLVIPASIRHFRDTQCGIKIFRADVVEQIFPRIKTFRWVFDIELFVIATVHKIMIYEMPVTIKPSCVTKKGGVSLLRHGFSVLRDVILIHRSIAKKRYE